MYNDRKALEILEAQTLTSYGIRSGDTRGRIHDDHEPAYRTPFQRDRDRIVHAEAFRKLEYKTQVFVNDEGDYYRTRLTHTLEGAQIGRTLARALGVNEDLVEAICLAHDLGHPPFGHSGEAVLNALMADHGGFNHNQQSYRVVTELERRYPNWPGLNLTLETLEGIAKHETEYDVTGDLPFDPALRGSLEAQIANIADELAYNAHDLDDGLQAGLLQPEALEELEIWRILCDRLNWSGCILSEIDRHRFIRELIGIQVGNVLAEATRRLETLRPQSPLDVQKHDQDVIAHSEEQRRLNRALKDFLYDKMYYHWRVTRMKHRAEHFVRHLFESYVSEPRQLPNEYRNAIPERGLHRVVADYIASMTDRSALLEYRRLFDPMTRP